MIDKLCVAYRTGAAHKAHLIKNILADYEINSHVADLNVATELGANNQAIEVRVHERDLELSVRIVEAFDRHIDNTLGQADDGEEFDENDLPAIWIHWPTCKRCGAVRETSCQFCETISTTFELADQEWNEESQAGTANSDLPETAVDDTSYPLLVCHTCSEPFEPKFYRHCAKCNLDLGEGEPAPELTLTPEAGFFSPAVFGWALILIALVILIMMSRT